MKEKNKRIHYVIFAEVFAKIIGKKARTSFQLHKKLFSLLKVSQNTI